MVCMLCVCELKSKDSHVQQYFSENIYFVESIVLCWVVKEQNVTKQKLSWLLKRINLI